jgi:starch phosphorylase
MMGIIARVTGEAIATRSVGREDVTRAAAELAERLPEPLAPLARLAYNYRWSWLPGGPDLFRAVDPERFERCLQNPVRLLQETPTRALRRASQDPELLERARAAEDAIAADLAREPWGDPARPVAFLCAEFGVHVSLPVYSGGLGVLAGDILKEASDRALPLVGVGLMYRKGYFRQRIDAGGWQHEYWVDTDPDRLPAAPVSGPDDRPLRITVPVQDGEVSARIWRVDVGRVPLFLLDTDTPENGPFERWITARLYDADERTRLAQYALLGIGGVRALRALGIDPGVIHLNEGHAALAPLEFGNALGSLEAARALTVFTTHTPVPAGNDTYPPEAVAPLAGALNVSAEDLLALGRTNPDDEHEQFGVTQAALRMSRAANGVSRRHGQVARSMWNALWPERDTEAVPIGHVTNGVHIPTWIADPMRELLDRHLGGDWLTRAGDPEAWASVDEIPDAELWAVRERQRAALVEFIHERSVADRLARGDVREYAEAARAFDSQALTLGFARRVATYKRLDLLMRDPERTFALLDGERPVQVVLAGKAHPRDEDAKRVVARLFGLKYARVIAERVVFLDDYDMATAARLVQGCDVWVNLPRPPLEASGTSGMKAAVNGGLQLSVLDGWWAEAYEPGIGWALAGEVELDPEAQDRRDATELHRILAEEVVPTFYEQRAPGGVPCAWVQRIRASLKALAPRFSATRMVRDYVEGPYRA